jgi:Fe-S oxidoreductase/FAD/FMN-containing dehydrogenase
VLDELNILLRGHGLQFGPDPASSDRAAMGGIVSNNSTGSHSILYGMTADHLLSADVILSDGSQAHFGPLERDELGRAKRRPGLEGQLYRQVTDLVDDPRNQQFIQENTPRHWRRCGGYNLDRFVTGPTFNWPVDPRFNLANLVCGAEGTLAVMTEMKLNLVPLPSETAVAIVHFDALYTALSAVPSMLAVGPSAIEVLDNLGLTMCREVPKYARLLSTFIEGRPNCVLITEFHGENQAELSAKIEQLKVHLRKEGAGETTVVSLLDPAKQQHVWTVRKVGLGLLMSIKGDHKPIPFIEDAAVPVEHLAEYVTKVEKFCNDIGTEVAYYAHASAGCLHVRPLVNTKKAAEIAKLSEITSFSADLLHAYGGALSSEHGDGRARSWINERFFGPDLYRLYKQVKQCFDPKAILNPGNIVDGAPMDQNLRYGETYQLMPLTPNLDFGEHTSEEAGGNTPLAGFDRALEMCNGAGICRKRTTGTMCPSFMVTRDETHSTRGRANALRAALAGLLPPSEITSPRMYEVMDLCIECKACKAECPSSVDMAKIKFEFLAQYQRRHGTSLRTKLFGHISGISRLSSGRLAPMANFGLQNGLVRASLEKGLGISAKRKLPPIARVSFLDWHHEHSQTRPATGPTRGEIVLLNDPFHTYNYPHVAIAATEFLEAAGFEVLLPGVKDDARPFISKGMVTEARSAARDAINRLAPFAERKIPIIGLEPSSLLSLRDEFLYLLPNDPRTLLVADQAFTFEEFVAELAGNGNLGLSFTDETRHILLHGHCHQKALVGTGPSRRVLSLPPNYAITEVDSGCCGMAGSFGYEAEHYDISMQMGERRLFPAVREAESSTLIVAAGVSCRQQIEHGTGRKAHHPAELLWDALAPVNGAQDSANR